MAFDTIRDYLVTKLGTLTTTGNKFVVVYDHFEEKSTGFPCIMLEPSSYSGKMHSTTDNLREYQYRIIFMQEMQNKNRGQALDILLPAVDDAIAIIESDYSLGGTVNFCNNTLGEILVENGSNGAIIYMEMLLNCTKETSITT